MEREKQCQCRNMEKREHYHYNIEAVGKNIKWEKGGGDGQFGAENQVLKKWDEGVGWHFIHPWFHIIFFSYRTFFF